MLKRVLNDQQIFGESKAKLLIITDHKDTLDCLAGDGKDGRPLGKLIDWGLSCTRIHGGMKIGDRDRPNTRIHAEREFSENRQAMVATEAAGEGINLQFCWMMTNYDIPWNPIRLEQRMGRIHRYGQERDCEIFNFVATNTREGRVLDKLLVRIAEIRSDLGSDNVFDVVGEITPSIELERLFREMYAGKIKETDIDHRIVEGIDSERLKHIANSTLECLVKRDLNLSALMSKSVEAKERRLVPEVVEDFFVQAAPLVGVHPQPVSGTKGVYRLTKVPMGLTRHGESTEPRYGALGREYSQIVFDKRKLGNDATREWVTPGHPLFEDVRERVSDEVADDMRKGTVLWDLHTASPYHLDVYSSSIADGRARVLHKRLFVVRSDPDGTLSLRQPTVFLDLVSPTIDTKAPDISTMPGRNAIEEHLLERAQNPFLEEVSAQRVKEVDRVLKHVEVSLKELIDRENIRFAALEGRRAEPESITWLESHIKQVESSLERLNARLDGRRKDLTLERQCALSDTSLLGSCWVLPHPERHTPKMHGIVNNPETEAQAVRIAMDYERKLGWVVESVENENRGYDLLSKLPHATEPGVFSHARFVEVKGVAGTGQVALTSNEYKTAMRLGADYCIYVVFDCAKEPRLWRIQNPAKLVWESVRAVEHYCVSAKTVMAVGRD